MGSGKRRAADRKARFRSLSGPGARRVHAEGRRESQAADADPFCEESPACGGACRAPPFGAERWFKDWTGQCAVIVAGGPSVKLVPIAAAHERFARAHWIAVNNAWKICRWADALYGCDATWWRQQEGAPGFLGLKLTQDGTTPKRFPDVERVAIKRGVNAMLFDRKGELGWGGNGGFHALNLAAQFGAKTIVLLGYDMSLDHGTHWHGRHIGLNNPTIRALDKWAQYLDESAPVLKARGIDVVVGSPNSRLTAFRKQPLMEVLDEFYRSV